MKKTVTTNKQLNKAYHSAMKKIVRDSHAREIYDSLSAGKNSYLRLDRLASSSFDKSWIEMIEGCIFDLGDIIANPRQHTKVIGNLTPVELARKVTSESVQHLASHTQYIKEVDDYGNVIPSKILSMSSDDDLHTYENRFIATFVRRLYLFISKRYEFVSKFAELHNEEVLYFKNKSIVDGAEVEIETKIKVSYKKEDEETKINSSYVERIKQTRDYISYFYNSPFMKQMKNEKNVRNPIVQTNIIRKNPKYRHCYEVYRFIETYDRLGVDYKIDENYSLFNDEEISELNRTLFANYVTLRGNNIAREKKVNTKVYKPKILTTLEDESFIYGPLLEGPISFARVDDAYQAYLDSKIKKDLPLHPTKKEKEYYADEYAAKKENQQDLKAKNDLLKRRQKELNAFEKKVKDILAKREQARLKLLEMEKEAIRKEEEDLLNAMRNEIINASKQDVTDIVNANNAPVEEPKKGKKKEKEVEKVYVPTVTFEQAADEIWPQLRNPHPIPKVVEKVVVKEVIKEVPVPTPAPEAEQPVKVVKVYTPTVTFDEAADEIWPQLNNPNPIAKAEEQVVVEVPAKQAKAAAKKAAKPAPVQQAQAEPSKPAPVVYIPTVTFDEAADEIWPQLNNPTPIVVEQPAPAQETEQPVQEATPAPQENAEQPAQVEPQPVGRKVKIKFKRYDGSEVVIYETDKKKKAKPVSFEQAADEIWPQLRHPHPLPKEEKKPAPVEKKPAEAVEPEPVEAPQQAPAREEAQPEGRKIKKFFKRSDGTVAIIYQKEKAKSLRAKARAEAKAREAANKEEPKQEAPKAEPKVQEAPKPAPKQNNQRHSYKEEKKENRPQQKVIKGKNSRKKFKK